MWAHVLHRPGVMTFEQRPLPKVREQDVLIRVEAVLTWRVCLAHTTSGRLEVWLRTMAGPTASRSNGGRRSPAVARACHGSAANVGACGHT